MAKRHAGRPRINPPPNGFQLAEQYSREVPRLEDIASRFFIDIGTLKRWMAQYPEIDLAIARGRAKVTAEISAVLVEKAKRGSVDAMRLFAQWYRPDLAQTKVDHQHQHAHLTLNVLPGSKDLHAFLERCGQADVIEGQLEHQGSDELPLFKGRNLVNTD